jgi:hypothetical protein
MMIYPKSVRLSSLEPIREWHTDYLLDYRPLMSDWTYPPPFLWYCLDFVVRVAYLLVARHKKTLRFKDVLTMCLVGLKTRLAEQILSQLRKLRKMAALPGFAAFVLLAVLYPSAAAGVAMLPRPK